MSVIDFKNKETIIFDLDGTLALSKSAIDEEMCALLESLLDKKKVLVMSGGRWKQFEKQLLGHLNLSQERLSKLFISPGSGSGLYRFDNGEVREVYADFLTKDEKQRIRDAFEYALQKSGVDLPKETYGETLEDRGTQMTYSALGQD
ncbi:MAG: HAD family hydrolase, partial [Minisyncoccota bacterium]